MRVTVRGKGDISLTQKDFISQGGEGKVFGKGNIVYKIYDDPKKKMIPEGKIEELSVLTDANILNPKDIIIDKNNLPVGFTMDWVKNTITLCKIFTNTYREENSIKNDTIIELVHNLRETVEFIHEEKCLIVDANELNFLVDVSTHRIPYFIDVDSYQTKSFPATAIMPSIRDWTRKTFSEETDWYSFATIACQLFIGIHPYKGKHPDYKKGDMKSRCIDHVSIFNKDVRMAKTVRDFDYIPTAYMDWFIELFEKGKRVLPPEDGGTVTAVKTKFIVITSTDNFEIREISEFEGAIIFNRTCFGYEITRTTEMIHLNGNPYKVSKGTDVIYAPKTLIPILVKIDDNILKLKSMKGGVKEPNIQATDFIIINNTLFAKNGESLIEFQVFEPSGKDITVATKKIWNIMPNSSEIFNGVIYQSVLGKPYLVIPIPENDSLINQAVPELEGYRILDAKYENGICVLICHKGTTYSRIVLKFNDSFSYNIRITDDIDYAPANFVVLENGVVALITDDGTMEVFSKKWDSSTVKTIKDSTIDSEMMLCKSGAKLQFFKGNKLYSIKMK